VSRQQNGRIQLGCRPSFLSPSLYRTGQCKKTFLYQNFSGKKEKPMQKPSHFNRYPVKTDKKKMFLYITLMNAVSL